jgi:para-nitrobenzyl esterase
MYAGNPNLKGDRPWPRYRKGAEVYLSENVGALAPITAAQFAAEHKCKFWDQILIYETPGRS